MPRAAAGGRTRGPWCPPGRTAYAVECVFRGGYRQDLEPSSAAPAAVLVVDDDECSRRLVRAWLEKDHEVAEAEDGRSALAALDSRTFDVVVLDAMMPGMNGFEVCREVKRRQGDGPFVPVVLLTGLSVQEDRTEALRAGADEFLTKPCDRTELRLRIAALVRARRQELTIRRHLAELTHLAELKDDLVSLIVHDLRSPLSGAMSLLRLVRDAVAEEELRDDLDAALAGAARASATAEELLEVRLLEEGKVEPDRRPECARDLALQAVGALEAAARARRVTIRVTAPDPVPFALDGRLVRRALENLLSNAVRYSPDGAEITVGIRRAGETLELEVADHGPGVPVAVRGSLFERFGAVDALRHDARRGFGLGLYLVRLVADAHGGFVSVHDRPGRGALFRLSLLAAPPGRAAASRGVTDAGAPVSRRT